MFSDELEEGLADYEEGCFNRRIIVCRESKSAHIDGVDILPAREFIERLWNDELVDASTATGFVN